MGNIKYEVIVYWSNEDKCFISEMPELPGCMSDGKTYEEAIENIKQVASMWLEVAAEEGREIPEPKGKLFYA
ncbi:MAG: type II toxin-antitoxin system HicB family antitoxin [Ignavibacteria bacterium]|nr:type II toxin-antitoxin system HicB family antitoxin [Ignavibacteria bacterium]